MRLRSKFGASARPTIGTTSPRKLRSARSARTTFGAGRENLECSAHRRRPTRVA